MDTGGPAFPMKVVITDYSDPVEVKEYHPGMTLRDYFAGQALIGFMTGDGYHKIKNGEELTKQSYLLADAMIEARRG